MSVAPVRLAVLGDPLRYTLSPPLHRAGLAWAGLAGDSLAIVTPLAELGARLSALAAQGYRGVNLTQPLKEEALAHLTRVSETASRARSVNTVSFGDDGAAGDTTDGEGFVDFLHSIGRDPERARVLLLGAGGAARSLAAALADRGTAVTVSARRPDDVARRWPEPPAAIAAWGTRAAEEALAGADVIVNATPLADPAPVERLPQRALAVDLRYEATPTDWIVRARGRGIEAYDGLGLLVFQARRSLSIWLGRAVPVEPLAGAVGWPR